MKRAISLLLAVAMLLSLATGCATRENSNKVRFRLPLSTGIEAVVEGEAVIATQMYLLARSYIEKLEFYDLDAFDARAYADLAKRAWEAVHIAEVLAESFRRHAEALTLLEENGMSPRQIRSNYYSRLSAMSEEAPAPIPFSLVTTAYAGGKSPAMQFAEEVTKTFDQAKNGQKLQAIAEKYGTDAKRAKVILEQSQAILTGDAYMEQADFENKCYQAAVETKAAASTAGFIVTVAMTGGAAAAGAAAAGGAAAGGSAAVTAAGIIEAGGLVCSGVNMVVDVGTAVTIRSTNGEGNAYTEAFDKLGSAVAPVSTAFAIGGGI